MNMDVFSAARTMETLGRGAATTENRDGHETH
jgi:hypothetical protein